MGMGQRDEQTERVLIDRGPQCFEKFLLVEGEVRISLLGDSCSLL